MSRFILFSSVSALLLLAQAPRLDAQCCGGSAPSGRSSVSLNDFRGRLSGKLSPKRFVVKIAPGDAHSLVVENLTTGTTQSIPVAASTVLTSITVPAPPDSDVRIRLVTASGGIANRTSTVSQRSSSLARSDTGTTQQEADAGSSCSSSYSDSGDTEDERTMTTTSRSSISGKPGDGEPGTSLTPPAEPFGAITAHLGSLVAATFQNANPGARVEMNTGIGFNGRGAPKLVLEMPATAVTSGPDRTMLKTSMLRGVGLEIGSTGYRLHSDGGLPNPHFAKGAGVVITDPAGRIVQLRTKDVLVMVSDVNPSVPAEGYRVQFYRYSSLESIGSDGLYPLPSFAPETAWTFAKEGYFPPNCSQQHRTLAQKTMNGQTKDFRFDYDFVTHEIVASSPPPAGSGYSACDTETRSGRWETGVNVDSMSTTVFRHGSSAPVSGTIWNRGPDSPPPIPISTDPNTTVINVGVADPLNGNTVSVVGSTGYYNIETVIPSLDSPVRDITILRPLPFGVTPNEDAATANIENCDATLIHHEETAEGWSRDWMHKIAGVQVERFYSSQVYAVHAFSAGNVPAQKVNIVTQLHYGSTASTPRVSVTKTVSLQAADARYIGLPVYRLDEDGTITDYNYTFGIADGRSAFNATANGTDIRTEATVYRNGLGSKYVTITHDGNTVFEESFSASNLVSRVAHGYTKGFRTLSERETTTGWKPTYTAQTNGQFIEWEMGEDGVKTTNVDLDSDGSPDRFIRAAVPAANGRSGVPSQVREIGKDCYGWHWQTIRETASGPLLSKRTWKVGEDGAIEEEVSNDWIHTRYVRAANPDLKQSVSTYQRKYGTAEGDANERLISTRTSDYEGRVLSVAGAGVVPETHAYSISANGWTEVATVGDVSGNIVTERSWQSHGIGRSESLPNGGANFRTYGFDGKGRVTSVSDAGVLVSLSSYDDATGVETHTSVATPDPNVVTTQATIIYSYEGKDFELTTTTKGTQVSKSWRRIGLLEPTTLSESMSEQNGVMSREKVTISGAEIVQEETPAGLATRYRYTKAGVKVAQLSQVVGSMLDLVSIQGDALGRPLTTTHSANGTSTTNVYFPYNAFGGALQSSATTGEDIAGTPNAVSTATSFTYYDAEFAAAGRVFSRTTDTVTSYFSYTTRGQQRATWGATYPVRYSYDGAGRLYQMETYRDETNLNALAAGASPENWGAGDLTTWEYWPGKNLLKQKKDAAGLGALYSYDTRGRMATRLWARNVLTTYGYNNAGQMRTTTYSDGTPNVAMTYDAQGRVSTLTDGTGTRTFSYDAAGRQLGEQYTGGGRVDGLHFVHDAAGRQVGYALADANGWATWQGWGYGVDGHQSGVMTPEGWVGYGYSANSAWPKTRTFQTYSNSNALAENIPVNIAGTAFSDGLGRLTRSETTGREGSTINTNILRTYQYNAKGQRDQMMLENGDAWNYTYNARNEVTGGQKVYGYEENLGDPDILNGTGIGNTAHNYTFDGIGNRMTETTIFGTSAGITIGTNHLNQITSRTLSANVRLDGSANPAATVDVKVNNVSQSVNRGRAGDWNSNATVVSGKGKWSPISVTETLTGQTPIEKTGYKFAPKYAVSMPAMLNYDADGNQTIDPRWNHTWDAENRLVRSELPEAIASVNPTMPRERITYTYDAQWRRATKKVETRTSATAAWVIESHMRYGYEGWNLIAEWDIKTSPAKLVRSHHWGVDLSGTRSGAGGVGGLVMTRHHTLAGVNGVKSTIPAYDGTGNILAYVDTADGKKVADYEYGPFGELLRESGPLAKAHPHRWSSKYTDEETGFSYYGYRYYVPSAGRWLSKDPIGERGGLGLYGSILNDPNHWIDRNGLDMSHVAAGTLIGAAGGASVLGIGAIPGAIGGAIFGLIVGTPSTANQDSDVLPPVPTPDPNPPPQPAPDPAPHGPNYNPTKRAKCDELMAGYKKISTEPIPPLTGRPGSKVYCDNLRMRRDRMNRLIGGREAYGAADCDAEDVGWNNPAVRPFPDKKTEEQRKADHEGQIKELRRALEKLDDLIRRYCTPC